MNRPRILLWAALAAVVLMLGACEGDDIASLPEAQQLCPVPQGTPTLQNLTYVDRGWWHQAGGHDPTNDFVFVGWSTDPIAALGFMDFRAYVAFDVSAYAGRVQAATLRLEQETFNSADPSETLTVSSVTTPQAVLDSSANTVATFNPAIFADLGDGPSYATVTVLRTDFGSGTVADIPLSPLAVCAINSAPGGFFAVGLRADSLVRSPASNEWVRFGFLGNGLNELALQVVP